MVKKSKNLILFFVYFSFFSAWGDSLISGSPTNKMDGENKVIALYGNSYTHYNNNLNTRLRDLTRSLLPDNAKGYSYRGITISSGRLGWHKENLIYQNSLKPWDVVIFQGSSKEPISNKKEDREFFKESAIKMAKIAHDNGSKVLYFMTWAPKNDLEKTKDLQKAYEDIAKQTGGYIAPVGLAFKEGVDNYPQINLYHSDGKHPSINGTYLAASVFFSVLYNMSPVGGDIPIDTNMTEDTARKLQELAWSVVKKYQSGKYID